MKTGGGGEGDLAATACFFARSLGFFCLADNNDSIELTVLKTGFLRGGETIVFNFSSPLPCVSFNEDSVDGGGGEPLGARSFPALGFSGLTKGSGTCNFNLATFLTSGSG